MLPTSGPFPCVCPLPAMVFSQRSHSLTAFKSCPDITSQGSLSRPLFKQRLPLYHSWFFVLFLFLPGTFHLLTHYTIYYVFCSSSISPHWNRSCIEQGLSLLLTAVFPVTRTGLACNRNPGIFVKKIKV